MGLGIYAHSPMRPTIIITPGLLCKDSANERNVRMLTFAECSLSSLFWMQSYNIEKPKTIRLTTVDKPLISR